MEKAVTITRGLRESEGISSTPSHLLDVSFINESSQTGKRYIKASDFATRSSVPFDGPVFINGEESNATHKISISPGNKGWLTLKESQVKSFIEKMLHEAEFKQNTIQFSKYELCKELGWPKKTESYLSIDSALYKLKTISLRHEVSTPDYKMHYDFQLIEEFGGKGQLYEDGYKYYSLKISEKYLKYVRATSRHSFNYSNYLQLESPESKEIYRWISKQQNRWDDPMKPLIKNLDFYYANLLGRSKRDLISIKKKVVFEYLLEMTKKELIFDCEIMLNDDLEYMVMVFFNENDQKQVKTQPTINQAEWQDIIEEMASGENKRSNVVDKRNPGDPLHPINILNQWDKWEDLSPKGQVLGDANSWFQNNKKEGPPMQNNESKTKSEPTSIQSKTSAYTIATTLLEEMQSSFKLDYTKINNILDTYFNVNLIKDRRYLYQTHSNEEIMKTVEHFEYYTSDFTETEKELKNLKPIEKPLYQTVNKTQIGRLLNKTFNVGQIQDRSYFHTAESSDIATKTNKKKINKFEKAASLLSQMKGKKIDTKKIQKILDETFTDDKQPSTQTFKLKKEKQTRRDFKTTKSLVFVELENELQKMKESFNLDYSHLEKLLERSFLVSQVTDRSYLYQEPSTQKTKHIKTANIPTPEIKTEKKEVSPFSLPTPNLDVINKQISEHKAKQVKPPVAPILTKTKKKPTLISKPLIKDPDVKISKVSAVEAQLIAMRDKKNFSSEKLAELIKKI
jgi:hypothetical protein